jgi:hypothetical protein
MIERGFTAFLPNFDWKLSRQKVFFGGLSALSIAEFPGNGYYVK